MNWLLIEKTMKPRPPLPPLSAKQMLRVSSGCIHHLSNVPVSTLPGMLSLNETEKGLGGLLPNSGAFAHINYAFLQSWGMRPSILAELLGAALLVLRFCQGAGLEE